MGRALAAFYASGRAIDLILLVLETAGLFILWRRRSRGVPPRALMLILVTGGTLLLAVRAALTGAPWYWVGLFLIASFVAHLTDLRYRWVQRDLECA